MGTVLNVTFAYSTKESNSGKELGYMNFDYKYESVLKSVGNAAPHMTVKYDFQYECAVSENRGVKVNRKFTFSNICIECMFIFTKIALK